ncbi:unnamed protein product [Mytilus edulis]|uniref:Uncharacterized protein n=1 Tax=Mytilus edulis TaxID=6550 RepID=A0A8S3R5G5_MYTED|nr:unnamed protein product [Mytilus edulis]
MWNRLQKENSSKYRNHNSKKGERKKHTAVSTMKSTVNKICGKKEEEIKKLFNEGIPKYIARPISPLMEPSPVDTEFEELIEELDEGKSDHTEINYTTTEKEDLPAEKNRGTDEEGAMEIAEIGELGKGGSAEINHMTTTIEILEGVLQKLEEDIRLTERCELPDGCVVYSITSHWVPEIPIKRRNSIGTPVEEKKVSFTATQTETGLENTTETAEKAIDCDIIACRFY